MSQLCPRCKGQMVFGTGSRGPGAIDAPRPSWGCPRCSAQRKEDAYREVLWTERRNYVLAALAKGTVIAVLCAPGFYGHLYVVLAYVALALLVGGILGGSALLARLNERRLAHARVVYDAVRREHEGRRDKPAEYKAAEANRDRLYHLATRWSNRLQYWRWFVYPPLGGLVLALASYFAPLVSLVVASLLLLIAAIVAVLKQQAEFKWCGKCGCRMAHSSANKWWCGQCRDHRYL